MFRIFHSRNDIHIHWLMDVYKESNLENGKTRYPNCSPSEQLMFAESDFLHYLCDNFLRNKKTFYAVWELTGRYAAAVRVEPYRDGVLICGLETAADVRQQGYATKLLKSVVDHLTQSDEKILYSHVPKSNTISLAVHRKCGFHISSDRAVYLDGSVLSDSYTLICLI